MTTNKNLKNSEDLLDLKDKFFSLFTTLLIKRLITQNNRNEFNRREIKNSLTNIKLKSFLLLKNYSALLFYLLL